MTYHQQRYKLVNSRRIERRKRKISKPLPWSRYRYEVNRREFREKISPILNSICRKYTKEKSIMEYLFEEIL